MERCPNCRARAEGADTCRRCGMDLRLLQATERAAGALCLSALGALAGGDPTAAAAILARARALVPDPFIARLQGFARHLADAHGARPTDGPGA